MLEEKVVHPVKVVSGSGLRSSSVSRRTTASGRRI